MCSFPRIRWSQTWAAHNSKQEAIEGTGASGDPGESSNVPTCLHTYSNMKHSPCSGARCAIAGIWKTWHILYNMEMHMAVAFISIQSICVHKTNACRFIIWRNKSPGNTTECLKCITCINFLAHSGWLFLAAWCKAVNPKVKNFGKHEFLSLRLTDVMQENMFTKIVLFKQTWSILQRNISSVSKNDCEALGLTSSCCYM